jgi:hypothetical protein
LRFGTKRQPDNNVRPLSHRREANMMLELTAEEAHVLDVALELHQEGTLSAKKATTEDPTLTDVDTLLDVMAQYDQDIRTITTVRRKLREGGD